MLKKIDNIIDYIIYFFIEYTIKKIMKYILFDKCIITIDENKIIKEINNLTETKQYKRVGNKQRTYICGYQIPQSFSGYYYDSPEILKKANDLYDYSKDTCGVYTNYYHTGILKEEYFHVNHIKNGIYKKYHDNGLIEIECNYINNILNGNWKKYDKDNNLVRERFYKNGKLNGLSCTYKEHNLFYNDDYKIIPKICNVYLRDKINYSQVNYIDGIIDGECIYKYGNYACTCTILVSNNIIQNIYIKRIETDLVAWKSNLINENNYKVEHFYQSGELYESYNSLNNENIDGLYTSYYKNGQINEVKNYMKVLNYGTVCNIIKGYYENGNIKEESIFNDDNALIEFISYYKNSKLNSKKKFKIGNTLPYLIETYNENGLLVFYKNTDYKLEYNSKLDIKDSISIENVNELQNFAHKLLDSISLIKNIE